MEQSGDGIAMIMLVNSMPQLTLFAVWFGEVPEGVYDFPSMPLSAMCVFVFLGFMGTLIGMSYSHLYKLVSATSVVVLSNFNKVFSIVLGFFVFRKPLSAMQVFGLCLCIAGGMGYAVQLRKEKDAKKYAPVATDDDGDDGVELKNNESGGPNKT